MKVIIAVFILAAVLSSPLCSFSVVLSSPFKVEIKEGSSLFEAAEDGILYKSPSFSFGSLSGGVTGILDNPYSSLSFKPSFSRFSKAGSLYGAALSTENGVYIFSFLGEREGAGVTYDGERLSLLLVSALSSDDGDYQKRTAERRNTSVIYLGGRYRAPYFSLFVLSSLSSLRYFNVLVRSSLTIAPFTVEYGRGRVQALLKSGGFYNYASLEMKDASFYFRSEIKSEDDPVYINEYRDYEYNGKSSLVLGDVTLSSTLEKTFRSGNEKRNGRISLLYRGFTLGWKYTDNSFFSSYEKEGLEIKYEDGVLSVGIALLFDSGRFRMKMSFSSKKMMEWRLETVI